MRKFALLSAVLALVAASLIDVRAASLAGVALPDSVQAGGKTLILNGVGLRTKFMIKVYVAGLYLEQKSSDATAILKSDGPKRLVMHFVRDVSKKQMSDAFEESFNDNTPDAVKTMKPDIDRLLAALEDVKKDDEMTFTALPGAGTTLAVKGKDKLTVAAPAFGRVIFSIWVGPKPPNGDLKKGILGQ